jgi:broad specificity phosphatase PhoE
VCKLKIELVRHFEVDYKFKKYQNSLDIINTCNDYDKSPLKNTFIIENKYRKVYISSLIRTKLTSEYLSKKEEIVVEEQINELTMNPIIKTNIKLPFVICFLIWKLHWRINSKLSNEVKHQTLSRVNNFLDNIENKNENVTIVGHAHIFSIMLKELKRRKYKGLYKPILFKNGEIREFEK